MFPLYASSRRTGRRGPQYPRTGSPFGQSSRFHTRGGCCLTWTYRRASSIFIPNASPSSPLETRSTGTRIFWKMSYCPTRAVRKSTGVRRGDCRNHAVIGLCVGVGSVIGLLLAVNYGLATQWMSFGQQGFHLLLVTSMIIFIGARAGRAWSLSGLILRSAPASNRRWVSALVAAITLVVVAPPHKRAVAAERRVFVSNEKSNDVTVIEQRTHQVIATIPLGQRPRRIPSARMARKSSSPTAIATA